MAKKTFYVLRCVGDKNQRMECAVHNFKEWSVLCTKSPFGDMPHTNFPMLYGFVGAQFYRHNLYFLVKIENYWSSTFFSFPVAI